MLLKNYERIRTVKNWQGSESIARKLYERGEPLTGIFRYLTQKANLSQEESLVIIKRMETDENSK